MRRRPRPVQRARGFTLLEAIVAIIITSVGLLGVAALQGTAISQTKTAADKSVAAAQVSNLIAAMKSTQEFWQSVPVGFDITIAADGTIDDAGADNSGATLEALTTDCSANTCTPAELTAFNLRTWATDGGVVDNTSGFSDRLSRANGPIATITRADATAPVMLDVVLTWDRKNQRTGMNVAGTFARLVDSNYRLRVQP